MLLVLIPRFKRIFLEIEEETGSPVDEKWLVKELKITRQMLNLYVNGNSKIPTEKLFKCKYLLNKRYNLDLRADDFYKYTHDE